MLDAALPQPIVLEVNCRASETEAVLPPVRLHRFGVASLGRRALHPERVSEPRLVMGCGPSRALLHSRGLSARSVVPPISMMPSRPLLCGCAGNSFCFFF